MAIMRRTYSLIIALAFVLGLLVHSPMLQAGSITGDVAVACADQQARHCDACADQGKGMGLATCTVACVASTAILASEAGINAPVPTTYVPRAEGVRIGRSGPPDPYPPRPLTLS